MYVTAKNDRLKQQNMWPAFTASLMQSAAVTHNKQRTKMSDENARNLQTVHTSDIFRNL